MRKALALLLALVLVTSVGAVYAAQELEEPADQVVFTETALYGDIRAAEGLRAKKQVHLSGNIVWDSIIDFGESGFASTTESLYVKDVWNDSRYQKKGIAYNGITIYSDLNTSYEGTGGEIPFSFHCLDAAQKELIAETPDGKEKEKIIRMSDYSPYYPLMIDIHLPDILYGVFPEMLEADKNESPEVYAIRTIQEFFRIPVLNSEQYRLGIEKDEDGTVIRAWGSGQEEGDFFPMYSFSVVSENACYFCFSNRTADNHLVDTSLIPGGYGIYILPYGRIEQENYHGSAHYEGYDVLADELRVFYPIDPQARILGLALSEDQKVLLLHTAENEKHVVTVISTETGEALQRYELAEYTDDSIYEVIALDDAFIIQIDSSYSVLNQKSETEWELLYQTVPTEIEKDESFTPLHSWYDLEYAFDGERIAVISSAIRSDGRGDGCGFTVAVYDAEGLQYYGEFESSLDKANAPSESLSQSGFNRVMNLSSGIAWK